MNPYLQNTMLVGIKGKINEKKLAYNNTLLGYSGRLDQAVPCALQHRVV